MNVTITQVRSGVGQSEKHRGTLRSLGLGRIGQRANHRLTPALEGKLRHVAHLVHVDKKSPWPTS
jgi:large subunit ribosomal protein L30